MHTVYLCPLRDYKHAHAQHTGSAVDEALDLAAVVSVVWVSGREEVELGILLLLLADLLGEIQTYHASEHVLVVQYTPSHHS